MKSYWQESIFKVLEVEDNIPVYKIKNLKKSKDIRTVHRNKLMKVEELALDIFDEEKVQQKPKTKTTVNKEPPLNKHIEDQKEDSDDSDVELTFENVAMEQVEDWDTVERNEIEIDVDQDQEIETSVGDQENEEEEKMEVIMERNEDEQEQEPLSEEAEEEGSGVVEQHTDEETAEDSSSSDEVPQRRSTRIKVPKKMMTYTKLGGNPTLVER